MESNASLKIAVTCQKTLALRYLYCLLIIGSFFTGCGSRDTDRLSSFQPGAPVNIDHDHPLLANVLGKVVQNGWVDYSFVDTNKDNKFDVFYSYEYGILKFSEKYIAATNDKSAYIEKIEYELGYPVKTTRVQTSITRDKFQRARSK